MNTFNDPSKLHDPGGSVRWPLPPGMRGSAVFSPCGKYRTCLERDWTAEGEAPRTIMYLGKNPSTADAVTQDPTCQKETSRAQVLGYTRYLKGNVLDYRATDPRDLPQDPALACSDRNLPDLLSMAAESEIIVMVYGRLHPRYAPVVGTIVEAIRNTGKPLFCFGRNQDGSAKHPLYLRNDSPLLPF
ncbi:DUF1643 domain-containing protein [Rhodovulum euryhalinum]|uniref:DUF1643 domain-containing protein n=1 Tax=Rhodovulum euryhalinum TaxID=35805 RepID=A0A4R2KGK7_9RHOB|nr:DUF1643 domain-containing protein [Rhodovulum euryhalinum]TCO69569.1 hypothetical protein EV655_11420 [Rhodovulum euryhalinum]